MQAHNALVYTISAKSINPRLSYSDLNIANLGPSAILDVTGSGFSVLFDPLCKNQGGVSENTE